MITQSRSQGLLGDEVSELAEGALTFETHDARSVLLAADDLVAVPRSVTPRDLEAVVAAHGFSRYPVVHPDGSWAGYVHVKDVLGVTARDEPLPDDALEQFVEVTPDEPLPEVLQAMRREGVHLGTVSEGGRLLGVVALEDVLEQLIGDVRDASGPIDAPSVGSGAGGR
jgi:CBS domain containing-hemolysin-like protein